MGLRLVMMGTGEFALPAFRCLYQSAHEVIGLFTQPDRIGRGHHHHVNVMKEEALRRGTAVFQPPKVNAEDALAQLRELRADLYVVAAYGQILSAELLGIPPRGAINVHASLLPRHRGASPVQYTILSGDEQSGVTIFQIDPRLDAGPVLGVASTPVESAETAGQLEGRLAQLAAPLTQDVVDRIARGTAEGMVQDQSQVTRAPRFRKEFGAIDWTRPAVEIERHIRAMQPWPKAFTFLKRSSPPPLRLILIAARCHNTLADETISGETPPAAEPGQIAVADGHRLIVGTGRGMLELLILRPEGKRDMPAAEFLHGHQLTTADRFTPSP